MGPPKLADTLNISLEEAEQLFKEYAKAFPKLNKWLEEQGKFAKHNYYSKTFEPCNRRRWYPDMVKVRELKTKLELTTDEWKWCKKVEGQTERNGLNMPIQGSGADVCKEALILVRELILKYNQVYNEEVAYLVCTVHDAIDCEVREDIAEVFGKEMKEVMIMAGNKYVREVSMDIDLTITKQWQK